MFRAMLAAALGKDLAAPAGGAAADGSRAGRKKGLAAARNAVVAEAYPESEAHAGGGAAGGYRTQGSGFA